VDRKRNDIVLKTFVSGKKGMRRVRGFSWTASVEKAKWFAIRLAEHLGDPAVYKVNFGRDAIIVYTNDREESEFILWPDSLRPVKIKLDEIADR
jgi:hypothetical protein